MVTTRTLAQSRTAAYTQALRSHTLSSFRVRQQATLRLLRVYNATEVDDEARRATLLLELLGSVGKGTTVRSPFYCDYGYNIHLGSEVFLNFGCVFLDVVRIAIGDGCKIGPYVQVLSADHPRDPALRKQRLEHGQPITIGANVWIGGGALILPGITVAMM